MGTPPIATWTAANSPTAIFDQLNPFSIGAILRDNSGEVNEEKMDGPNEENDGDYVRESYVPSP